MDHHEQHHLKHEKEREREKKVHQKHEREADERRLPFHPAWFIVIGVGLTAIAILVWTILWA